MLDQILTSTSTVISPAFTQALNQLLSDAVQLALLGISAVFAYAVKLGISHLRYSWEQKIALTLVKYASQKFVTNEEKLTYVKSKLKEAIPRLNPEQLDHAVESAVVDFKNLTAV